MFELFYSITLIQVGPDQIYPAIETAWSVIGSPINLFLLFISTIFGFVLGMLPGLGAILGIALLIPITFDMAGEVAVMMMAACLGGAMFGGAVTTILMNIPGSAGNLATLLDGYPLTQEGRAGEAIAASAVASATGALIGLVLLILALNILIPFILLFGPAQIFWVTIIGLITIAIVSREALLLGLISGAIGLFLGMHGANPVTGGVRFDWGVPYLFDGIPLVPLILGLFAVAEMANFVRKGEIVQRSTKISGDWKKGLIAVLNNKRTVVRSALIGWLVGVVPGAGAVIANFLAYVHAMESSKDPDSFGKGNIVGVIAPEAANDAKDGGALLPTLALGVPGSAAFALLLGAFLLHGITPGPVLFEENLHIVLIIIFSLVIANITVSLIGLILVKYLVIITRLPIASVAPIVIVISLIGAFAVSNSLVDVAFTVFFGIIGYMMLRVGISRINVIIGYILGPIAERNFHQALQISQGDYLYLVESPVTWVLILIVLILLVVTARS